MSSFEQNATPQVNQSLIEQTMQYLKDSFTQKDKKLILEATQKLEELSKNFETHFQTLLQIITLPQQQCPNDIKQSAGIYIKNMLKAKLPLFDENQLNQMLSMFINLLLDSPSYKSNKLLNSIFNKIIIDILTSEQLLKTNNAINNIFPSFTQLMTKASQESYITLSKDIFVLITYIFQSKALIEKYSLVCLQGLFTVVDNVVSKFNVYMNTNVASHNQINCEFIVMLIEMFDSINTAILESRNKIKGTDLSMSLFQRFGKVFFELITFSYMNVNKYNFEGSIIYFTDDFQLNKYMNNLKAKVIQTMTWIVQLGGDEIKDQNLLNVLTTLLEMFIKTLDFAIKNYINDIHNEFDYENDYSLNPNNKTNGYCNIFYNLIAFFVRVLIREPIKTKFIPLIENFLGNIIYPCIVPPLNDIGLIKSDGESYCQFFDDMVDIHQFKNFRAASVYLFKKLKEKIVDISGYVLYFIIEMFTVLIQSQGDPQKIEELIKSGNYSRYAKSKNENHSIHLFPIENQLQFCFIILSTYDEYLQKNKFLNNTIKTLFINNLSSLHSTTSIQVQDALCYIYDKFIPNLFNDEFGSDLQTYGFLSNVFKFLLTSSLKTDYPGLTCHAIQALLTILDSEEMHTPVIQTLVNDNFSSLIELVNESEIINYFTLMDTLLYNIKIENKESLFTFLNLVVKRILREIGSNNDTKENYIDSCFQIIKSALTGQNEETIKEKETTFENMITPIVNYIANPKKIDFEDGIINLVYQYMSIINRHSSLGLTILKHSETICEVNNKILDELFDFLNLFINIDVKTNNSQFIIEYLPSIIKVLTFPKTNNCNEASSTKYALLISLKLISLNLASNQTIMECFSQIINAYIDCFDINYNNNKTYYDDEKSSVKCINYVLVALISMFIYTYPEHVFEYLVSSSYNKLDIYFQYVSQLQNNRHDYYYKDFSKCHIFALYSLLINETLFNKIKDKYNPLMLLNNLFDSTCWQKKEEIKHLKEKMKNEVDCNFVEEDEEEENKFNSKGFLCDNLEEEDIEELIDKCAFSYLQIDEFEYFTKCLQYLQQNKSELFKQFIDQLNDIKKFALNEIVHVRKMQIKYEDKILFIPRRAVKIKRRNMNNETQ